MMRFSIPRFLLLAWLLLAPNMADAAGDVAGTVTRLKGAAQQGPPLEGGWSVSKGACPSECCSYGNWTVKRDTLIYGKPKGARRTGVATKGQKVKGLDGIVYVSPVPVEVIHESTFGFISEQHKPIDRHSYREARLVPGQTIYFLDYIGEAHHRVWVDGIFGYIEASEFYEGPVVKAPRPLFKSCRTASKKCWWRIASEDRVQDFQWWVNLRLPNGTEGWSSATGNFSNIHSCN